MNCYLDFMCKLSGQNTLQPSLREAQELLKKLIKQDQTSIFIFKGININLQFRNFKTIFFSQWLPLTAKDRILYELISLNNYSHSTAQPLLKCVTEFGVQSCNFGTIGSLKDCRVGYHFHVVGPGLHLLMIPAFLCPPGYPVYKAGDILPLGLLW